MAKKTQNTENAPEKKEKPREVELHRLSNPPQIEGKVYEAGATFGGKLPKGEVLHKFAIQLPIPGDLAGVEAQYGLTPEQAIERLVKALYTDLDGAVKKVLFDGIKDPSMAYSVTESAHQNAQEAALAWKYEPRSSGRKTTKVSEVVATLVAAGMITPEQAETIETVADLDRVVKGAMGA